MPRFARTSLAAVVAAWAFAPWGEAARGAQIWLKDGRVLEGKASEWTSLVEQPRPLAADGAPVPRLIVMVDDELRRTFVSQRQIQEYRQEDASEIFESFRLRQPVIHTGPTVRSVGPFRAEPFDEFGRRIVRMVTDRGPENIIQCITEITPLWTKIEGSRHVWDMRVNTSSIPPDVLAKILNNPTILASQGKRDPVEIREKIARFYLHAERYQEASATLERILADFPGDDELRRRLEPIIQAVRQRSAKQLLDELKLRQAAGQHRLVQEGLKTFPADGVAGNILEGVRQMVAGYESLEAQRKESLDRLDALARQISDTGLRERIAPIREEIASELSVNTIGRMAPFRLMLDDQTLLPAEKVSLALSGWLLGGDSATVKLPLALSVYEVRGLIRAYMNAADGPSRAKILEQFYAQEGATPQMVAKLLREMKPPLETPPPVGLELPAQPDPPAQARPTAFRPDRPKLPPWVAALADAEEAAEAPQEPAPAPPPQARPGYYELEAPGLTGAPPSKYLVQLPPEYDPYRRYPAILTLHGAGSTPDLQIAWWAGDWTPGGWRNGQATRRGYVVIAPRWAGENQAQYGYSLSEHVAVLNSLRDACRRFAIDTDRVFLTGHSMGGDAAWDIGLAHPDLWAGVIPIVALADKYCSQYWENASLVPFYFVCGELDGSKLARNARELDRYLKRGYNCTVVEYRGRGHEHFSDEIQRLFDWMGRTVRNFYPREFSASSMRPWDNFFWWIELESLPSRAMVDPIDWPPPRGTLPVQTKATILQTNGLNVQTGAAIVRVWLSPQMLKLDQRVNIVVNGRRIVPQSQYLEPDLATLLEDVRTRGDRQHPFWIKVESATGRIDSG